MTTPVPRRALTRAEWFCDWYARAKATADAATKSTQPTPKGAEQAKKPA